MLLVGLVVYFNMRDSAQVATSPSIFATKNDGFGARIDPPVAALKTAERFVAAAVLRKDLETAWALSSPSVRGTYTKEKWLTGSIPVVPYPGKEFAEARYRVSRAFERQIVLYVLMTPTKGAEVSPQTFVIKLEPAAGAKGRWLVSYWAPAGGSPPIPATP
jgi:hypothetical protein